MKEIRIPFDVPFGIGTTFRIDGSKASLLSRVNTHCLLNLPRAPTMRHEGTAAVMDRDQVHVDGMIQKGNGDRQRVMYTTQR